MPRIHPIPSSIYVPILPSQRLLLLAQAISPWESSYRQVGFRPFRLVWDAQGPQGMDTGSYRLKRSKVQWHNKVPIGIFPGPDARFGHVRLDIVGPLSSFSGCSHHLTCMGRFTWWPKSIPLPDIAAPTVVKVLLSRWVAIFGAPSTITIDRGCTRIRTKAYSPAANAMVERSNCQLKTSLRVADDPENRTDHFSLILLGIRSALKPDLDCSAVEMVFGATVQLPVGMILPTSRGAVFVSPLPLSATASDGGFE
ncbi:hypothetical protein SprV_0401482400 [Sparganum proliferum]